MATSIVEPSKQELLRDLLKQVSRLFYTTLIVVPADVRDQVSLAYLFARAADTIADTELIDRSHRLDLLSLLKRQFASDQIAWTQIREIQRAVGPINRILPSVFCLNDWRIASSSSRPFHWTIGNAYSNS